MPATPTISNFEKTSLNHLQPHLELALPFSKESTPFPHFVPHFALLSANVSKNAPISSLVCPEPHFFTKMESSSPLTESMPTSYHSLLVNTTCNPSLPNPTPSPLAHTAFPDGLISPFSKPLQHKHIELLGSPFPRLFEADKEPSSKMDPNLSESVLDLHQRGTKANLENPDSNLTSEYPSWKGDNSSFLGPSPSLSNNFSSHPNPSSLALSSSPSLHSSNSPEPTFHEE